MDALVDLSWRAYPASLILAVGGAVLVWGLVTLFATAHIAPSDRGKPISLVTGIRLALVGGAIAALGASWLWQQLWLFILALAIGGEELLETSVVLYVLRRSRRLEARSLAHERAMDA